MCFLASPPAEIGPSQPGRKKNGQIGMGGFGGTCAIVGKRFGGNSSIQTQQQNEYDDPESVIVDAYTKDTKKDEHILPCTAYTKVDDYFQDLGIQCATAAFGVEIFGLIDEVEEQVKGVYFGFSLLRLLSDRSGGCGPLLVPLQKELKYNKNNDILVKELVARSPWNRCVLLNLCQL